MKLANRLPAASTATRTTRQILIQAARDLWHAVAGGPDEPPPPLQRLQRSGAMPIIGATMLVLPFGWLVAVFLSRQMQGIVTGAWWPLVMLLTVALLVLAAYRPLLAWRVALVVLLYEAFASFDAYQLPSMIFSEVQILLLAAVLFLVATSQPAGVVGWVWLLTSTAAWLIPLSWSYEFAELYRRNLPVALIPDEFFMPPGLRVGEPSLLPVQIVGVVAVTGVLLLGQLTRRRSQTKQRLASAEEHGLVLTERARIARELHDVVAHHMSMIAVRAETAPYRLRSIDQPAREEFEAISQESRTALAEMRRLLGVLRSNGSPAPTAPQPGLADLADLVESARAAGANVALEMHGAMTGLPAAVDLSGYRIVQEALANAAQHAAGAPVQIILRRAPAELEVVVRNGPGGRRNGAAAPPEGPAAAGHGVRGMRERVTMLGGTLYAGLTTDGGFEVSATLPLTGDRS